MIANHDDAASAPLPIGAVRIDDPDDDRLEPYRDLKGGNGLRQRRGARDVIVEGRVAVTTLLGTGLTVHSVLLDDHQVALATEVVDRAVARRVPILVASRRVIAETVGFALHRGVVAHAERPPVQALEDFLDLWAPGETALVAEGVVDQENLGALGRNAAAFGACALVLDPTSADPRNRRSVRVSAGHLLTLPLVRATPWPSALALLARSQVRIAALVPPASTQRLRTERTCDLTPVVTVDELAEAIGEPRHARAPGEHDLPRPRVALLVGSEGHGLSPSALAYADVLVTIPIANGVDSVNLATAAAIALHHLALGR
ncbi:tRNA/rRNA methyltransferase (SpoU) [Acidimicrobium ferrooxidans DSM 10331]|uniref:tRNA/rRNA methyltransferase (SpoU) n=1 Tax=Acidimicrobium ferrooxidans (strain DSM 10331 / JCM 15462 / NBRC 103882 / ICP) TaxID=525909 RepID=C7LYM9_ACIFD|nr:RNA methyltransferase [Acidimicrobium ferrooxidans]ACU53837.1 tRNA/rRNA methyltransferase (SpoU) [Acidimicrobium ferrooxidans DSM 10331]